MGDDNEDMEGFRIWKTAYWQQFPRGQAYHIRQILIVFFLFRGGVLIGPRVRCMSWTWFGPAYRGTSIPYS